MYAFIIKSMWSVYADSLFDDDLILNHYEPCLHNAPCLHNEPRLHNEPCLQSVFNPCSLLYCHPVGVKYKKLGGIYGHFFNDLSPGVRELVMGRYKENKELIRDER